MTTKVDNSVIEKVRKLLDLAANSKLGDAENASLLAQKLMIQHNLTSVDIKEKSPQDPNLITHKTVMENISKNDKQWKAILLHVITQNFLCKSLTTSTGYILIGPEGNTTVARELYEWLISALTDIGRKEYQSHKEKGGLYGKKTWSNSFYLGAINSIRSKLDKQREDLVQGNPLVLASESLIRNYTQTHFNPSKVKLLKSFSEGAYKKGVETGKNLPTNPRRILD